MAICAQPDCSNVLLQEKTGQATCSNKCAASLRSFEVKYPEIIPWLLERYQEGASTYSLARELRDQGIKTSYQTVFDTLRRVDPSVIRRKDEAAALLRSFTDHQEQEILDMYQGGMSCARIGEAFGVSRVPVTAVLERNGVARRDASDAKRQYPLWEEAFSDMTSLEAQYWAGMLMADGCISKRSVVFWLQECDRDHVEALRSFLKAETTPIFHQFSRAKPSAPAYGQWRLVVTSQKMVDDLAVLNVVPRKSKVARVPSELLDSVAFWRGMMDGDGCISISGKKVTVYLASGSPQLIDQFASFLQRQWGLDPRVRQRKDLSWTVTIRHGEVVEFLTRMYLDDSLPALPRKRLRAQEALETRARVSLRRARQLEPYVPGSILLSPHARFTGGA